MRTLDCLPLPRPTLESSVVKMLHGWIAYASAHKVAYDSEIGKDYFLGDEWLKIGMALLSLLNGDLGRLDAGTLDTIIRDKLTEQGFDPEIGERIKS